ncbi:MAG: hypothetical protein GX444_02185 [Myxococcales bacterium]|nr:hypothetical protein [Myxococcales bacterium]
MSAKRLSPWGWWCLLCLVFALAGCDCGDDDDDDNAAVDDDNDNGDDDNLDDDNGDDDDDDDDDDNDDDTTPWPPNELVDEGKLWLHRGDGDRADLYFRQALDILPLHPEANYGLVIGNAMHNLDLFGIILDYVYSVIDNGGPVKDDPDNLLDNFLAQALDGLQYASGKEQLEYAQICLEEGYVFQQDEDLAIPIIIHFERLADIFGQFDEAELHAAVVPTLILWGLLEHVDAVSLDCDYTQAYLLAELDWDDILNALKEAIPILINLFEDPAYPDFFTFPAENIPQIQDAGLRLAEAMEQFRLVFPAVEGEAGEDQATDVFGYDDQNGNQKYDAGEPYRINGYGSLDADQMEIVYALRYVATKLRDSFWDYTEYDVDPDNPNPFHLSYLNPLLQAFGLPALIPDWSFLQIDFGAFYADPGSDGLKQLLLSILRIAEIIIGLIG